MNKKYSQKEVLEFLAKGYEELFFQNTTLKTVITLNGGVGLAQYARLLLDAELRRENHARFAALHARIAALTDDSDLSPLLAEIPEVPKKR